MYAFKEKNWFLAMLKTQNFTAMWLPPGKDVLIVPVVEMEEGGLTGPGRTT
jgi:hypothetical protein